MLTCPICTDPLTPTGAAFVCPRGHTFDMAREGYVNLLVGRAHGAVGDTKEMLRARRTFLERGFYAPLSQQMNAMAAQLTLAHTVVGGTPPAAPLLLDAGCGEGYYLGRLYESLAARFATGTFSYLGIDIAKEAVRLAAKRYHHAIRFAVADVKRRIPVADASVALLLNIFAPRHPAEFARVVAPGGTLLIAIPGPRHLIELRERYGLIGIEPEKARHIAAQLAGLFTLVASAPLDYTLDLSGDDVRQLLIMTPNARHRERQGWQGISPGPARVSASFVVLAFRREP